MTQKLLRTLNFDIWCVLATCSDIFNNSLDAFFFKIFHEMETSNPAKFEQSKKFWNVRFGPNVPKEIVNLLGLSGKDFTLEWTQRYPTYLYVRVDS